MMACEVSANKMNIGVNSHRTIPFPTRAASGEAHRVGGHRSRRLSPRFTLGGTVPSRQ